MIKTKSNFKLFDEDIIPKFYCLMVPYSFIVVFNQTTFIFLIAHKPHQLFSQLTTTFFTTIAKPTQTLSREQM
jgi:hypothetical protein